MQEKNKIEKYLNEKTTTGAMMAILEAEKEFSFLLKKIGIKGKDTEEQVQNASLYFSNPIGLIHAREVAAAIKEIPGYEPEDLFAEDTLKQYKQAITDLERRNDFHHKSFWKKIIYYFFKNRKNLKVGGLTILIFLLTVVFLSDTNPGKYLGRLALGFIHSILAFILFVILGFVIIFVFIIGIILILERRK